MAINYIELNGEMISQAEYCRRLGVCRGTITSMMSKQNLTFEQAVEKYLFIRENEKYDIDLESAKKSLRNRWDGMKDRCYNPKDKDYYRYGERGIRVCDRWLTFNNFFSDMYDSFIAHVKEFGLRNTTLDRVDHDGNYEPSNCDWKTIKEQNNNRCINVMVTEDLNVAQFAEKYGLNPYTVANRVKGGWTVEEIINPSLRKKPKKVKKLSKLKLKKIKLKKTKKPSKPKMLAPTGETIPALAKRLGINRGTIYERIRAGWDWDKILNTEVRDYNWTDNSENSS